MRLHIDGGEMRGTELTDFLEKQGTEIVTNVADVHSNVTIERRHRTLKNIHNAQMNESGAPAKLWEFSIPNANTMINLNIPIKAMLAAGRVRDNAQRPITPFELMECKGMMIALKKL